MKGIDKVIRERNRMTHVDYDTNPFPPPKAPPPQVDEDGIQYITVHAYFDEDGKWQMRRVK
jgi:hypothetical protein